MLLRILLPPSELCEAQAKSTFYSQVYLPITPPTGHGSYTINISAATQLFQQTLFEVVPPE